jgi:N-methylhydantoinase B/acetone carboxylase, alpha subunit
MAWQAGDRGHWGATGWSTRTGSVTTMKGCDSVPVGAGDIFVLETPGGGGYGPPE